MRSAIARRLGVDIGALAPVDRSVEGVVEMVLDATAQATAPLTPERLFGWHAALFPTGYSGLSRIRVGAWRDDANGAMQVVSGAVHQPHIHYEAPPAARLEAEIARFLAWANAEPAEPALIRAGLAHVWLVTLHPFEDGNGRIARAVGDLFLARAAGSSQRFYSLSAQIQRERNAYYGHPGADPERNLGYYPVAGMVSGRAAPGRGECSADACCRPGESTFLATMDGHPAAPTASKAA
ncbi:MAG: Fic family protein [Magnetococcus sp. YQC-3]